MDDKWNGQAAPNNNNKASDMKWSFEGSPKTIQAKVNEEGINNKKIESEVREQSF